jgi:putative ABC transport system ATP-binding protein
MVMLKIDQLIKKFPLPNGSVITALDGFSLTLSKGDFAVIIGPNGSGKSTLFDLIAGRSFANAGRILFDGRDITFTPPHRRASKITLISQSRGSGLPRAMTVREVIELALGTNGISKLKKTAKDVSTELDVLGPGLSGIIDEHISQLAPDAKDRVLRVTTELIARKHLTAVLATHDPDVATVTGNRQLIIKKGKLDRDYSGEERIRDVADLRCIIKDIPS